MGSRAPRAHRPGSCETPHRGVNPHARDPCSAAGPARCLCMSTRWNGRLTSRLPLPPQSHVLTGPGSLAWRLTGHLPPASPIPNPCPHRPLAHQLACALHAEQSEWWAANASPDGGGSGLDGSAPPDTVDSGWALRCIAELPHRSQVWRVAWNPSGSMLAASEDDGTVRLYAMDALGGWRQATPVPIQK